MIHRQEVHRQLLEAGCHPAALFHPADALLDGAAPPVRGPLAAQAGEAGDIPLERDTTTGMESDPPV